MSEVTVNDSNFEQEVLKAQGPVMADFWATWCGPCRMLSSVVDELATQYEGKLKVCKINADEAMNTCTQYRISSIPALLFFKNGQLVAQTTGLQSKAALEEKINALL